ncbi:MAG: sigma-70 family RNA polymerase sigma factor [Clostridiales bacterium]|nr:sigma-70 family RNA polymerase sigma factor [Clostridiales bacterium]
MARRYVRQSKRVFSIALIFFELEDLSYLNKMNRHIEQSQLSEQTLNSRAINAPISVEETALRDFQYNIIHRAIAELSDTQRKRIPLYYFEDLTYEQIAKIESYSVHSIFVSIERAKEKTKNFYLRCKKSYISEETGEGIVFVGGLEVTEPLN